MGATEALKGEGESLRFADLVPFFAKKIALFFDLEIEQARLDGGVAGQAPIHGGELVDEIGFWLVGGTEVVEVVVELGLVFVFRFVGEHDCLGCQAVFDGVERDGAAAVVGGRTTRFSTVDAGSFGSGRHRMFLARV